MHSQGVPAGRSGKPLYRLVRVRGVALFLQVPFESGFDDPVSTAWLVPREAGSYGSLRALEPTADWVHARLARGCPGER